MNDSHSNTINPDVLDFIEHKALTMISANDPSIVHTYRTTIVFVKHNGVTYQVDFPLSNPYIHEVES